MRRFSTLAITVLVGLMASCQKPRPNQAVKVASVVADPPALPDADPIVRVAVTCPDTRQTQGSVSVDPWTVHVSASHQQAVTWQLSDTTLTLSAEFVFQAHWPFQQMTYPAHKSLTASLNAAAVAAARAHIQYQYRLRINCPNQVIEIDPVVIVDP